MAFLTIRNPASSILEEAEVEFGLASAAQPYELERTNTANRVAEGQLSSFTVGGSGPFPEVEYLVKVYVPSGFRRTSSSNLIIFNDGLQYLAEPMNVPFVLDRLVLDGALPSTVAVFVEPGSLVHNAEAGQSTQRGVEYNSMSDAYCRLLSDVVLPRVEETYSISRDPRDRVICGFSAGGFAAFNAAWHRPDLFGGVICHCASYSGLSGGDAYPALIRSARNRPLRVFLQSGARDMDRVIGNFAVANFDMAAALKLKGYDYRFEFGNGGHELSHAGVVLSQTLRWIWRS